MDTDHFPNRPPLHHRGGFLLYNNLIHIRLMKYFAIFYQKKQDYDNLPIVMTVSSEEKFLDCCDMFPTDWAYLLDEETGQRIAFYHGN